MHHWPGGDSNSSESSTSNESLVMHKMEGQYQILYKEKVLKASSPVSASGKRKFVMFYNYSPSWYTVINWL